MTLLHERETDEGEARYVATTIGGTPGSAIITIEDVESKDSVLRKIRQTLESMRFAGRIVVYDVTEPGVSKEYEV